MLRDAHRRRDGVAQAHDRVEQALATAQVVDGVLPLDVILQGRGHCVRRFGAIDQHVQALEV